MTHDDKQRVYRLGEVRALLGLSEAATRGWLAALETATGEPLPREPGGKLNAARLVPAWALEAIRRAQAETYAHRGRVTADDALRRALGLEAAPLPLAPSTEGRGEAFAELLRKLEALAGEVEGLRVDLRAEREGRVLPEPPAAPVDFGPVLEELATLRWEVAALRGEPSASGEGAQEGQPEMPTFETSAPIPSGGPLGLFDGLVRLLGRRASRGR